VTSTDADAALAYLRSVAPDQPLTRTVAQRLGWDRARATAALFDLRARGVVRYEVVEAQKSRRGWAAERGTYSEMMWRVAS